MDTIKRDIMQQHRKPIFVGLKLRIWRPRHVTVSITFPNVTYTHNNRNFK